MQINNHIITLILLSSVLSFVLAGLVSLLTYSYHLKRSGLENKLHVNLLSSEKLLLKTQFEIQEEVIQQISREIHDNINLSLTLAKMNLQKHTEKDPALSEPIEMITESIVKLNNISKTYSSEIINDYGFLKALEIETNRVAKSSGIDIALIQKGEPVFFDNEKDIIIFRIVQECLNNIIRHSRATKVEIETSYIDPELTLRIIDNGIGIDLTRISESPGLGLRNMKTRTKHLNGCMTITPMKDKGTLVELKIPYSETSK